MPTHLVRGYHGTTLPIAKDIVANRQIKISTNDYDMCAENGDCCD